MTTGWDDERTNRAVAQLTERLAAIGPSEPGLVVQQLVVDSTGDVVGSWHWCLGADPRAAAGTADSPDVTFRTDSDTAAAIASGEVSPLQAVLLGKLSVDGEMDRLTDAYTSVAKAPL